MTGVKKTILIVCDDEISQQQISQFFENTDCDFNIASNREQGIELVNKIKPDLIICDRALSKMKGLEYCRLLRKDKNTGHIPIVVLTSDADKQTRLEMFNSGVQFYVVKPFERKRILEVTSFLLSLSAPDATLLNSKEFLEQSQNEFISVVSHELRTPMTSIKSAVGLLSDGSLGDLTPEQKEFFELMERNIHRLTNLINDVSDVSRIESGKLYLDIKSVNMSSLIADSIKLVSHNAEKKNISIQCCMPDEDVYVMCDSGKISQVIFALIENSIDHNSEGTEISVGVTLSGSMAQIWVKDTGQGISKADQEKIFDRFYQVDRQVGQGSQGLGLGLVICHGLIKAHQSVLRVESELDKGSKFFFDLKRV